MIALTRNTCGILTWCMVLGAMTYAPYIRGADALETYQAARKAWQDGDSLGLQAAVRLRDESKPGPDPADLLAKQDQAYELAEKSFREALKADDKNALIQADWGRFLVDRKRYREAADNLYLALQNPNAEKQIPVNKRSECLRVLGGLFERAGQSQRANTAYRQAVEINPTDYKAMISYACGLCIANQSEEAVALLEPRLKEGASPGLSPADRSLGLYTLAYAQEESGYAEEALQTYRLAYRLAKTLPDGAGPVKDQAQGAIRRLRNALQEIMEKKVRSKLDGYRREGDERLRTLFSVPPDAVTYAIKEIKATSKDEEARLIVSREPLAGILAGAYKKLSEWSSSKAPSDIPPGEQFIKIVRSIQKAAELESAIDVWVKAGSLDARAAIQRKEPFLSILADVDQRRKMARQLCLKGLDWKRAALKDRVELMKAQQKLTTAKKPEDRQRVEEVEPLASLIRALHCFQDALQAYPYVSRLHRELGFCYLALGDMDNAWIHFEAALAYDPLNPSVLSAQGEICLLKQDWEQGIDIFEKLENIDPENGPAFFGAARAGLFLRRSPRELESAVDAFEKAELLGIFGPSVLDYRNKAQSLLTRMENGETIPPEPRTREARAKAARKSSGTPDLLRNTLGE